MRESTSAGARGERRLLRASIALGLLTLVLVGAAGGAYLLADEEEITARASVVVLPSPSLGDERLAGYYETLSNGQIAPTYAEVLRNRIDLDDVDVDVSRAALRAANVEVRIVPDTVLLDIAVTAADADDAERIADAVAEEAVDYVDSLGQPFVLELVAPAETDEPGGPPVVALLVVVAVVAVAAALGTQQLVFQGALLVLQRTRTT